MTTPLQHTTVIFCDGACSGNPGPGGWGAIVATPAGEVWEMGGAAPRTTNNQMELTAAIEALLSIKDASGEALVYTDSVYVIRGITQWIFAWKKRGWKTGEGADVANRNLWEALLGVVSARGKAGQVHWHFVRGHNSIPGNERVDAIAVAFSKGIPLGLYRGPRRLYEVPLDRIPSETALPEKGGSRGSQKPEAVTYLSLLGGTPMRHATWAECERRVKGKSGAKFKKVKSPSEEAEVLRSWGIDPKTLG